MLLEALMRRPPGPVTETWLSGKSFVEGIRYWSMLTEIFAPWGEDIQTPMKWTTFTSSPRADRHSSMRR
jgi:hypothetical protein